VNFQDRDYKIDFMNKIVDIILFIMKEDIFYSSRFMDIFNKIPHVELTKTRSLISRNGADILKDMLRRSQKYEDMIFLFMFEY